MLNVAVPSKISQISRQEPGMCDSIGRIADAELEKDGVEQGYAKIELFIPFCHSDPFRVFVCASFQC